MTPSAAPAPSTGSADKGFADLVEELTARLQAGQAVDPDALRRDHPEYADRLEQLLPALRLLADVSRSRPDGLLAPAPDAEVLAGTLGDFRLIREVGRGGMGIVYEAEQISLGRRVALKVLPFASTLDPKQLQRFKNESQAAAQLHHQNIVPVYATGCERGVHYYAMQFIDGQTLAAAIAEVGIRAKQEGVAAERAPILPALAAKAVRTVPWVPKEEPPDASWPTKPGEVLPSVMLPPTAPKAGISTERSTRSLAYFRNVAQLGVQAAEALEHAHQLGIVHRDIKPANLLVDDRGKLWVTDFGLAHCQSQAGLTMTGDLVGTLRYMSPEQALAKRVAVDHRTDIYSLGVTLYELLTLERAYDGRDREELLRQIAFEEPRRPRQRNKNIPAELETIVLKAMEKNPADRYGTAAELGEDLRRFLEDRPIQAKRPTLRLRLRKWGRRHRSVVLTLVASLAVLLLSLTAAAIVAIVQINAALGQAKHNEELERAAKQENLANFYTATLAQVQREFEAGNVGLAEQLLDDPRFEHLHDWGWYYLKRLRYGSRLPLQHSSCMCGLALSPDGQLLAAGGSDGWVMLWHTHTWQEVRRFQAHGQHVHRVAFGPRGKHLATASWDGTVKIWDVEKSRLLHTFPHYEHGEDHVGCVVFSPDGSWIASGGAESVKIWDAATGECQHTLSGLNAVQSLALSPDGRCLAAGNHRDETVQLWDTSDWTPCGRLGPHNALVIGLAFSPDGTQLAVGCGQFGWALGPGEVAIWDVATQQKVHSFPGHVSGAFAVAFTPDGHYLASGGVEDALIKLWDLRTGREVLTLRGHWDSVWGLAFSPDGRRLYSAGLDHTVRDWDATPLADVAQREVRTLGRHALQVTTLAFSPDRRRLVSGGMDGTIRVWDALSGQEIPIKAGHPGPVRSVAFRPGGKQLASGSSAPPGSPDALGEVKLWDTRTWREPTRLDLKDPGCDVGSLAFRSDGRCLAFVQIENLVVWDLATDTPVCTLEPKYPFAQTCVAFGPEGRVASSGTDGSVQVWDLSARREIALFAPLALPPNITSLVHIWRATTEVSTYFLRAHEGRAACVAFSPDDAYLASAGMDGKVKLWDARTCQLIHTLRRHRGSVHCLAFRPDGKRLASAGSDAAIHIWDVATRREVLTLRGHTNAIFALAFSPDGRFIASGGWDGTVKLWDLSLLPEARREPADEPDE
jgi:WD40 repeat protein/serine/threonine protein kinase